MSDYFGHLVSRTLFPSASVQPRLASVFEPNARADVDDAPPELMARTGQRPIQRRAELDEADDARAVSPAKIAGPVGDAHFTEHVDLSDADGDIRSPLASTSH